MTSRIAIRVCESDHRGTDSSQVFLMRGASDPFVRCIYEALDATEFYLRAGAWDEGKTVSLPDVYRALKKLDDFEPDPDRLDAYSTWLSDQGLDVADFGIAAERKFLGEGIDLCRRKGLDRLFVWFG
ncbi:MAG: hypothetical protein O3C68_08590 [Proteobacteria bacterium]|nr:hypothetical protein [Pseudomonadota bacterium]